MNTGLRLLALGMGVWLFVVLFELIRRRKLKERHAIFWVVLSVGFVLLAAFPGVALWFTELLGFELPSNLLFFGSLVILFAVALQTSVELARLGEHTRRLAEELALTRLDMTDRDRTESGGGSEPPDAS
jgi:hypothetical protein